MPKKLTDKDRLLAFAFRASTEELYDAISLLKAAHAAKVDGRGTPRPVKNATNRRASATPTIKPSDSPAE